MSRAKTFAAEPAEKEFYLQRFRNTCIVLHVDDAKNLRPAARVLAALASNPTMVLVVARRFAKTARPHRLSARALDGDPEALVPVVQSLLAHGRGDVLVPRGRPGAARLAFSRLLARRIGARKLVVVDERGALPGRRERRSFVSARSLARICRAGSQLGAWTVAELAELQAAVDGGLESVNLTTAAGLEAELFSYEGAGTLLTAHDYCSVGQLGVADFDEARRLLARGEREGFLLERSDDEKARLLLCAYGAWFGGGRLAGLASLATSGYSRRRLGEIAGLYTITKFKGEGVGVRIIDHLVEIARKKGLRALFACTSNERAAAFFERNGFVRRDPADLPPSKWDGRTGGKLPTVLWRDI